MVGRSNAAGCGGHACPHRGCRIIDFSVGARVEGRCPSNASRSGDRGRPCKTRFER